MKKIILATGVMLIFLIQACEKPIDISSVTLNTRLVVNALLNNQDQISIGVSQSTTISDSVKPAPIRTANVVVIDKSGNRITCTYDLTNERYICPVVPHAGDAFSVIVSASGFQDAYAQLVIPGLASAGKALWRDSTSFDSLGFPNGTITVTINDNGAEKNYYRVNLYHYETSTAEFLTLQPALDDAELNQQAIFTEDGGVIFTDKLFNGKNRQIKFTTPFGYGFQTPKFMVVVENLSTEYYRYFKSLDDYKQYSGVFGEPPQVFTNISNGLGIFAGSSIQRDTIR